MDLSLDRIKAAGSRATPSRSGWRLRIPSLPRRGGMGIGETRRSKWRRFAPPAIAGAIGAGLSFLLDPESGSRRRAAVRERMAGGFARFRPAGEEELAEEAAPPEDALLEDKVKSEIFRAKDVPRDRIAVHAEHGVVHLRGVVKRPEQVDQLAETAAHVPGVSGVENRLHPEGTPEPQEDREPAGKRA